MLFGFWLSFRLEKHGPMALSGGHLFKSRKSSAEMATVPGRPRVSEASRRGRFPRGTAASRRKCIPGGKHFSSTAMELVGPELAMGQSVLVRLRRRAGWLGWPGLTSSSSGYIFGLP